MARSSDPPWKRQPRVRVQAGYEQSKRRIDAFWERYLIDRPVVQFTLTRPADERVPLPLKRLLDHDQHESVRGRLPTRER